MDRIAERANVSKQTIYNQFKNKESLFLEIVRSKTHSLKLPTSEEQSDLSLDTFLVHFADNYLKSLLEEEMVLMYRLVIGNARQFPSIAKGFYETFPAKATEQLEHFFEKQNNNGSMNINNPKLAAEQFSGMLKGAFFHRMLLCVDHVSPSEEDIHEISMRAVDVFLHGLNKLKYW